MDKLTIIRLLEVGRYWRQYQAAQKLLEQGPANPIKKEQLTAPSTYQTIGSLENIRLKSTNGSKKYSHLIN